jgi:hypothetical protein
LHNKPHGCVASVASAAGPFTTKKSGLHLAVLETYQGNIQARAMINIAQYGPVVSD